MLFNSLDGVKTHDSLTEASIVTNGEDSESVVLEIVSLPFRRLWNITVYAYDCEHQPLMDEMELGIKGSIILICCY